MYCERSVADAICLFQFVVFSIRSVISDARSFRIRPVEIALGMASVIVSKAAIGCGSLANILAGGVIGALTLIAIARFRESRLGQGDVWFSSFIGFAFGFEIWDICMIIAAVLGLSWVAIKKAIARYEAISDIRIPFTPFMFVGAVAVAIYRGLSSW